MQLSEQSQYNDQVKIYQGTNEENKAKISALYNTSRVMNVTFNFNL